MKRFKSWFPVIAAIIIATFVLSACGGNAATPTPTAAPAKESAPAKSPAAPAATPAAAAAPKALTKLQVGYDGLSITTGPMQYTLEKGIFKKYGLDVELVHIEGGSRLTQAIVGGTVPVGQNGYNPALTAGVQGGDIVIVGGISNVLPYQLVVKPNITGAAQFKGAKVAISRTGSSTDVAMRESLKKLGVDPKDVSVLQIGNEPDRVAAMLSGQLDATVLQYPGTGKLEKAGFKVLLNVSDFVDFPNTAYVSTRKYVSANKPVIRSFMMAMIDGIHQYKTNKDDALKSSAKFLEVDDLEEFKMTYDYYSQKVFPDIPRPTLPGMVSILKDIATTEPKAASAKAEDFLDTSVLDELEKEGFAKQITGK